MFRKGEKVRFLNEVGEATVLQILPDGLVKVEDEYGLVTSLRPDELVSAERKHVAEKRPEQSSSQPIQKLPEQPVLNDKADETEEALPELALIFLSDNAASPETGDVELFFSNGSDYQMLVNIAAREQEGVFSIFTGEIKARQKQSVRSVRRQDLDMFGQTMVDCVFYKDAEYMHREAFSAIMKIKATRFVRSGNYQKISALDGKAMVVEVKPPTLAESLPSVSFQRTMRREPVSGRGLPIFEEEVDLHIECLTTDHGNMTDHEMFSLQMKHFENCLNRAISKNYIQMTFIHGVGKGRLRDAIRDVLAEYELRFEDGPFQKYGMGATVAHLR